MVYQLFSSRPEDTEAIGKAIAQMFCAASIKRAFLSLYGEMGVGKTAFVRGFASAFDISGVRSPTYTMVNEYKSLKNNVYIFHFDLYRIACEDDLYSIGFDDYLARNGYCIAEWSENAESALPEDRIRIEIARTKNKECERRISIMVPDGSGCDFSSLLNFNSPTER